MISLKAKSVHNFVSCSCGQVFVDGGLNYQCVGFHKKTDYINLCEYKEIPLLIWQ